ncbi:flagellar export protein FliJ [Halobacillus litoralis]|uniref:flagellar export protein FliJ n=1 Tax=Halobacillus litoralis TaxID=45668 RepID=UPI002493CDE2|nr:flagellar export protein FliJ [Halobacillus litoralis]
MADIQTFEKIKDIRDKEKREKQLFHQEAVDIFERKAEQLYDALKKKETAVHEFNRKLSEKTVQAGSFIQHQNYIARLEEKIDSLQPAVQQARVKMQQSQSKLTEAHVEVKKYETLIENKYLKYQNWVKSEENKHMDELSMQQYLNFQNR